MQYSTILLNLDIFSMIDFYDVFHSEKRFSPMRTFLIYGVDVVFFLNSEPWMKTVEASTHSSIINQSYIAYRLFVRNTSACVYVGLNSCWASCLGSLLIHRFSVYFAEQFDVFGVLDHSMSGRLKKCVIVWKFGMWQFLILDSQ